MGKTFTMIDEPFICAVCGNSVNPLGYSARDHCPYCLYSLHLDINPGDRLNECMGLLEPMGVEKAKKGWKIIYRCKKCRKIHKNIAANDDDVSVIIRLSANQ